MVLTLKPMRATTLTSFITNVPQVFGISGVAVAGAPTLSYRTIRRAPYSNSSGFYSAWMAQCRNGDLAVGFIGSDPYASVTFSYFLCDPTLVDYSLITRTGYPPRLNLNPVPFGGSYSSIWNPFNKDVGTARVMSAAMPGFVTASGSIYEQQVRVITTGGIVTANKIPTLIPTTDLLFLEQTSAYSVVSTATFSNATYMYYSRRYLGGTLEVSFGNDSIGAGWKLYVSLIDPGTLEATVFTVVASGAGNTTASVSEATLNAAGIYQWDQIYVAAYYNALPPPPPEPISFNIFANDSVTVNFSTANNVPPWYDMPGIDGVLVGGYYS